MDTKIAYSHIAIRATWHVADNLLQVYETARYPIGKVVKWLSKIVEQPWTRLLHGCQTHYNVSQGCNMVVKLTTTFDKVVTRLVKTLTCNTTLYAHCTRLWPGCYHFHNLVTTLQQPWVFCMGRLSSKRGDVDSISECLRRQYS